MLAGPPPAMPAAGIVMSVCSHFGSEREECVERDASFKPEVDFDFGRAKPSLLRSRFTHGDRETTPRADLLHRRRVSVYGWGQLIH